MVLQGIDFARQFFDAIEGHDAHFRIFEGDGVACVMIVDDAVEPNDFTGHLKTRNLVTPVFRSDAGLEKTGANGIERSEGLSVAKECGATLDLSSHGHDVINALQLLFVQTYGHAQFSQVAVGTGDFDGLRIHGHWDLVGPGLLADVCWDAIVPRCAPGG
jgi:hypothetical protein